MTSLGFWKKDHAQLVEDIQSNVSSQFAEFGRMNPSLTLWRFDEKMLTLRFPDLDEDSPIDRIFQLNQVVYLSSILQTTGITLFMDTVVDQVDLNGDIVQKNAIAIALAGERGCSVFSAPYSFHPEVKGVIWNLSDAPFEDEIDNYPHLLHFSASFFTLSKNVVNWKYYLLYLEQAGFLFDWHAPFDKNSISLTNNPIL